MYSKFIFLNLLTLLFVEIYFYFSSHILIVFLDILHLILDISLFIISYYVVHSLKKDPLCTNKLLKKRSQLTIFLISTNLIIYFAYLINLINTSFLSYGAVKNQDEHVGFFFSIIILSLEISLYLLANKSLQRNILKKAIQIDLLFDILTGLSLLILAFLSFFIKKIIWFDRAFAIALLLFFIFPKLLIMLLKLYRDLKTPKEALELNLENFLKRLDLNIVEIHKVKILHLSRENHYLNLHLVGKDINLLKNTLGNLIKSISNKFLIKEKNIELYLEAFDKNSCANKNNYTA